MSYGDCRTCGSTLTDREMFHGDECERCLFLGDEPEVGTEEMDQEGSCPECGAVLGIGPDCDECIEMRTGGHA